jgi:hypothetical protein
MSGAFAGGVSVLLFQGIDVIKSRMQVSRIGPLRNSSRKLHDHIIFRYSIFPPLSILFRV